MKIQLVDDAKNALKWFSVNLHLLNISFLGTWSVLPDKFQDALPPKIVLVIAVVLLVLGIAGRFVKQTPDAPAEGKPPQEPQ